MGNAFALLQVKAILAVLLREYEFELINPKVDSDFRGLVVSPKEPCRLRYRRRQPSPRVAGTPKRSAKKAGPDNAQLNIELDYDLCQGHAVCVSEVPEVFGLNEAGKVMLHTSRPDPKFNAGVRAAAKHCPQRTILLSEEPPGGSEHEAGSESDAPGCPFG